MSLNFTKTSAVHCISLVTYIETVCDKRYRDGEIYRPTICVEDVKIKTDEAETGDKKMD